MILFIILVSLFVYLFLHKQHRVKYDYKCFLLTVEDQKKRREQFFKSHNKNIPIETIYGPDTRKVKNVEKFEEYIEPEYFEKAIKMHYDSNTERPDITYFNLGAIGCFFGHMEFYKRCFAQGLKYALIFEDNVIIKSNELYNQIQSVIDEKGDDFEMCFFHCLSRISDTNEGVLENVKWISSTKCYLVNVDNMKKYINYFYPMDNHIDMKHEDIIDKGARVYYKDLRKYIRIDRTHQSTINHRTHGKPGFISRQFPLATPANVKLGY